MTVVQRLLLVCAIMFTGVITLMAIAFGIALVLKILALYLIAVAIVFGVITWILRGK